VACHLAASKKDQLELQWSHFVCVSWRGAARVNSASSVLHEHSAPVGDGRRKYALVELLPLDDGRADTTVPPGPQEDQGNSQSKRNASSDNTAKTNSCSTVTHTDAS